MSPSTAYSIASVRSGGYDYRYCPESATGVPLDAATHYGLIAQEVARPSSRVVATLAGSDYLGVDYTELVGALFAAARERNADDAALPDVVRTLSAMRDPSGHARAGR